MIQDDVTSYLLFDRGPQFVARFWNNFWKQLGLDISLTSGFDSQSNSQTKCIKQELFKYLHCYCLLHPTTWAKHIFLSKLVHNQLY